MNKPIPKPDNDSILHDAWGRVVGCMTWLQAVLFGEFADHRPLSAVIADMLLSFAPGIVIVTSARDAVAIVLRLACHPEKREELMEWVLLCSCLIVIALPIAMAAGGALAAGAGAAVGGIVGSELAAALRAVMLLLIRKSSRLVDLVLFLQKFIKGDVLKLLRAVKFVTYEKVLLQALNKIIGKLRGIVGSLRAHLEGFQYFDSVKVTIARLTEWEGRFYSLQQDALRQIPRALGELDARLAKVLGETLPKETHTIVSGIQTEKITVVTPEKQRVRDTPGKILVKTDEEAHAVSGIINPKAGPTSQVKLKPAIDSKATLKDRPIPSKSPDETRNTKKQAVGDAAIAQDRARITMLSNEGKIIEARSILQPYVDAAQNAKSVDKKRAAMREIVERLDVSSDKEKLFWSGNKELARKIAKAQGKTILEETAGGKVIDDWMELNSVFSWNPKDMAPHGWDLWGEVSQNYTRGVSGEIHAIQDIGAFPKGGPTWRNREWAQIVREQTVTGINIHGMDKAGNEIDVIKVDPYGEVAKKLFGG